jgi:hypothetical protein
VVDFKWLYGMKIKKENGIKQREAFLPSIQMGCLQKEKI